MKLYFDFYIACFMIPFVFCEEDLLCLTVARKTNPGLTRYLRSLSVNALDGKVLGLEKIKREEENDVEYQKIPLLKEEMENYKNQKNLIILYTESSDVIITNNKKHLIKVFKSFDAQIVFGAENLCWPNSSLASEYPKAIGKSPYLNSGMFMGYAHVLYKLLNSESLDSLEDDQLFYTKIFLKQRQALNIKLDTNSKLFQSLHGVTKDVELESFSDGKVFVYNSVEDTKPSVIHGNRGSQFYLNTLANYVPLAWNSKDQCTECTENTSKEEVFISKNVLIGVFINKPTPFLEEFFDKILELNYPFQNLDFFIYNGASYHDRDVKLFVTNLKKITPKIRSLKVLTSSEDYEVWHAKDTAVEHCVYIHCDYFFHIDSEAHIDNPQTLKLLMEQNRDIIAPMMIRPYKLWSNFWGALDDNEYYARSFDYEDIVKNKSRGLWNVPFISTCYLVSNSIIYSNKLNYVHESLDPDMALCKNLREENEFMYVTNRHFFGHLIANDNTYNISNSKLYNDMWEILYNPLDWEMRYIHDNYTNLLKEKTIISSSCPEVYHVPFFTPRFTEEMIEIMETYGKWSDGFNNDSRIEGGYEAFPTRDIHMKQINFEKEWLEVLRRYVAPLTKKIFMGYDSYPPRSVINFVARYRPDEQPSLRPHHDTSTYTINVALNQDYEGGGCRFIRYNCSIVKSPIGWLLMHPGQLTHLHEGLATTKGTRYILISFIDP